MPTNFKYVPLSPEPISGRSVLEQTERAINELGDAMESGVDAATTLAQQAVDTANSANVTANSALIEAQNANTAAQAAQGTADTALNIANTAQSTAQSAQTVANSAFDNSAIAITNSSQALDYATSAQSNANTALSTANTAIIESNQALQIAQNAYDNNGVFIVDNSVRDAHAAYLFQEKSFLTNTSTDTPNINFPIDISTPCWFMVYINSDGTSVTHTCWDDINTSRIYTETASINNTDPANPVVTWSPWQSVATPNNLIDVQTEVDPAGQPSGTYLVFTYDTESGQEKAYFNLTANMPVYTPGNGAIEISTDYRVSLMLDPDSTGASVSDSGLKITVQTVIYGEIRLLPCRTTDISQFAPGWYFCNGDRFELSSAVGTALNALPANFKTDWGITVSGTTISIPNLFATDGRGYFLRPGTTPGVVVDDTIRPITGSFNISYALITTASGALQASNNVPSPMVGSTGTGQNYVDLNTSRLGAHFSGTETAPLHITMTPAIFLGV